MKLTALLCCWVAFLGALRADPLAEVSRFVPEKSPRTGIVQGRLVDFRTYVTSGAGAQPFARIRRDLDEKFSNYRVPADPITYGNPSPSQRDSAKADKWRNVQDICGESTRIAEAATLCWLVTGEDRYLQQAKTIVLDLCRWSLQPDWKAGDGPGASDITYNDEAHFRLWRKLPLLYDQLRGQFNAEEKTQVLAHFRERGRRSAAWIEKEGSISKIRRNNIEADLSSHPVRFMAMTGLAGLALWDDLPEAKAWWTFAYTFYRDQFSPWGGDDGGWAEGNAYWRGTFEHAAFQDALLAINDPLAYASPFWKNTPWFAVYLLQPYRHTIFGDTSNAGHFNLEPGVADFLEHLARVQQQGAYAAFAALCTDHRPRIIDKGISDVGRTYPTAAEVLLRNFTAAHLPLPKDVDWAALPPHRYFKDIGWVTFHSALGRPADDIHLTFKSSPYGSFSHSHADQNAFILNAFGESLLINSAYREFHNSAHHQQWTRQSQSKNLLLIDGKGQKAQSKQAVGQITRYHTEGRLAWTTGDATAAYALQQPVGRIKRVTRDVVFVDQRYFVLRDVVELETPGTLSWLLHSSAKMSWDAEKQRARVQGEQAFAEVTLLSPATTFTATLTDEFPVPVDPKYARGEIKGGYLTGQWGNHWHLSAATKSPQARTVIFSVLWPGRTPTEPSAQVSLEDDVVIIKTLEGREDRLHITDTSVTLH